VRSTSGALGDEYLDVPLDFLVGSIQPISHHTAVTGIAFEAEATQNQPFEAADASAVLGIRADPSQKVLVEAR
jgi:hypothetical protein